MLRNLFKEICQGPQHQTIKGITYKPVALEKYKVCMEEELTNVKALPCRLVVNENNCWLGCIPDVKVVAGDINGIAKCECLE